jgi:DNA mismatch repair protein MutS2
VPRIDDKTLADLGWSVIREAWSRRCHTTRAAERVSGERDGWLDLDAARLQLEQIAEARALRDSDSELPFGGITDVRVALARASKGATLGPEDLLGVARTAQGCARLADAIRAAGERAEKLSRISRAIAELGHVYHPVLESFDDDGTLSDHASDILGKLRRKVAKLVAELERKAHALMEDPSINPHLQDRFYTQRDDRYVVPVKVESRGRVAGIVHGTSGSGQTVFIEPQVLVELNNELKLAECEVADEERRIYAQLSGYIAEEVDALREAASAATRLDEIDGAARLAADLDANSPVLEPGGPLSLERARHPLMLLAGKRCVPNDVALGAGQTLVISGPNAGGKTVALKTTGLAALMAAAGLPVCAEWGSALPWFDHIGSDIGDSQSLEQDLSTFSARLLHLADFLNHADDRSLVLIDEIAVGTEPEQGAALAQAVLETLAERRVMVVATTHYERLKLLAGEADSPFVNASVGYDLDKLEPTFELHLGPPGSSGALRVARRMGLARTVLARAESLLGDQRASVEALIKSLEDGRRELAAERDAAAAERRALEEARSRAEAAEAVARERAKKARESAHDAAVSALKEARRELEAIKERVKKRGLALKEADRQIDAASRSIGEHAPRPPERGRAAEAAELEAGDVVFVPSLGSRATVLSPPGDGGKVVVSLGALKTTVDVAELRVEPGQPKRPTGGRPVTVSRAPASDRDAPVRTGDATLDLRGQRADEAVAELDRFVDRSMLSSRDVIFVIHGHGTGALRSAVRAHLESSPVVAEWHAADPKEGGDGVTIAFLDV